jgi:hypothetical protein
MLRDVTGVKRGDTVSVSEEPGTWRAVPANLHEAWNERVAISLRMVTPAPRTPHGWPGRGSRGAHRHRGEVTLAMRARTPDALDESSLHHCAGCVVR